MFLVSELEVKIGKSLLYSGRRRCDSLLRWAGIRGVLYGRGQKCNDDSVLMSLHNGNKC